MQKHPLPKDVLTDVRKDQEMNWTGSIYTQIKNYSKGV